MNNIIENIKNGLNYTWNNSHIPILGLYGIIESKIYRVNLVRGLELHNLKIDYFKLDLGQVEPWTLSISHTLHSLECTIILCMYILNHKMVLEGHSKMDSKDSIYAWIPFKSQEIHIKEGMAAVRICRSIHCNHVENDKTTNQVYCFHQKFLDIFSQPYTMLTILYTPIPIDYIFGLYFTFVLRRMFCLNRNVA